MGNAYEHPRIEDNVIHDDTYILVKLNNNSRAKLTQAKTFFKTGKVYEDSFYKKHSDSIQPYRATYYAFETSRPFGGVAFLLTYDIGIPGMYDKTLQIMGEVPYNKKFNQNYFALGVGSNEASSAIYDQLRNQNMDKSFIRTSSHLQNETTMTLINYELQLRFTVTMTSQQKSLLDIKISSIQQSHFAILEEQLEQLIQLREALIPQLEKFIEEKDIHRRTILTEKILGVAGIVGGAALFFVPGFQFESICLVTAGATYSLSASAMDKIISLIDDDEMKDKLNQELVAARLYQNLVRQISSMIEDALPYTGYNQEMAAQQIFYILREMHEANRLELPNRKDILKILEDSKEYRKVYEGVTIGTSVAMSTSSFLGTFAIASMETAFFTTRFLSYSRFALLASRTFIVGAAVISVIELFVSILAKNPEKEKAEEILVNYQKSLSEMKQNLRQLKDGFQLPQQNMINNV